MNNEDDNAIREDIIRISRDVFKRHGLSKVSMDDISKACGKSRSSLYHYFKNKKEVFEAFVVEEFTELINDAGRELQPTAPIETNLYAFNSAKLNGVKRLTKEYYNIIEDLRDQPEIFIRLTKLSLEEENAAIIKILRWGIANGNIAKLNDKDIEFLSSVLVTAFRSFEQELILYNRLSDMEDRLQWLIRILCKGLV